jgi:nucleotide-binding universal stress UspA family protein
MSRIVASGPVLIAFDGSPAAEHAIRESAALLGNRTALVVSVWEEGIGFETVELPSATVGLPPVPIDVRTAMEIEEEVQEQAQRLAQHGAELARQAGLEAEGLAVADDVTVTIAETLVNLAQQRDAAVIVMGSHSRGRLSEALLGSTTRDVIRRALCPVLVVRQADEA